MLDDNIWRHIQKYYYLYRFWINVNNDFEIFTIAILEVIIADWYDK